MKVPNDLTDYHYTYTHSRVFSWSKRCLEEGTFRRLGGDPGIQISLWVGTYSYRRPGPPPNLHLGLERMILPSKLY